MIFSNTPLQTLHAEFADLTLDEALIALRQRFDGRIAFSTSLGLEDQVITDAIFRNDLDIDVFTLDTGRNFTETYDVLDATRKKYGKPIKAFYPQTAAVERYVTIKGINAIYESVENRKECCYIRKIEPLNRALQGAQVWITGLRAAQSSYRADMGLFERDEQRGLLKFNPLLHAITSDLWTYIRKYDIPYNKLHSEFYPSIGCAPCTRAVAVGEDERAGRWWWESHNQECGLHDGTRAPVRKAA
ncbi:phosphoadenylyl-sulfate reductase [Candidatus Thiothrix sp. Deng01]|uniref:Adenosine 5'-phosphosulfate reductase n=1 Tax=Candidatus Thiothrix phosphatis TaxID=3112415 RepID=A0ABU6D066_9GAMM|nr:phosphoadenylyl-sulfate reductase [Candidatus Thiothrix sp. Deng01]MEB4591739.1 phosphoadenylyl-sulfate reductase [Candidatus Thiothrix sp. Deng01]